MATVIATVLTAQGDVWARDESGDLRKLEAGDKLYAGEVLVTADNASVQLDFGDGSTPMNIGGDQQIAMLPGLMPDASPDQQLAQADTGSSDTDTGDASVLGQDVQNVLAALNADDGNIFDNLQAPAAGATGGGGEAGGGIDFVQLSRIALDVGSLNYDFAPTTPLTPPTIPLGAGVADGADDGPGGTPGTPPSVDISDGGTAVSEEGLRDGIGDGVGTPDDTANSPNGIGHLTVGSDSGTATVAFDAGNLPTGLTSGGDPVEWAISSDGQTLTGYVDGNGDDNPGARTDRPIVTVTIDDNGDYEVTLNGPLDHDPEANVEDVLSFDVGVTATSGAVSDNGQITVRVEDDSPAGGEDTNSIDVTVNDISVGDVHAGWINVDSTSGKGAAVQGEDNNDDSYDDVIKWGTNDKHPDDASSYAFDDSNGTHDVQGGNPFTLGTFTHHNVVVSSGYKTLDSADLKVSFDVTINGQSHTIGTTIHFDHDETPNSNGGTPDIITIYDPSSFTVDGQPSSADGTFTIDGQQFALDILGFVNGDGDTVNQVYTDEGKSTSFELQAQVAPVAPQIEGNIDPQWGADGPADSGAIALDGDTDGDGVIHGTYGTLTMDDNGHYSYVANSTVESGEHTETFTYTLTDADGDTTQSTLTINVNGSEATPEPLVSSDVIDGDHINGTEHFDWLSGGDGDDTINGLGGADMLNGGDDNDTIHGDDGMDVIWGGAGQDTIDGGGGLDMAFGGDGDDTIHGGQGHDMLYGAAGDDTIYGDDGLNMIFGNTGDDDIHGGANNEFLLGNADDDMILGGAGADYVAGGAGSDTLTGDDGADRFVWQSSDASDGGQVDVVTDFSVDDGDKLNVSDLLSDDATADNIGDYLHFESDGDGGTTIQIDANGVGDGNAGVTIDVQNVDLTSLGNSDQEIAQQMIDNGTLDIDH